MKFKMKRLKVKSTSKNTQISEIKELFQKIRRKTSSNVCSSKDFTTLHKHFHKKTHGTHLQKLSYHDVTQYFHILYSAHIIQAALSVNIFTILSVF